MGNIGKLTQKDKEDIQDAASVAIKFFIENHKELSEMADYLANGNISLIISDILHKGMLELGYICEIDKDATEKGL